MSGYVSTVHVQDLSRNKVASCQVVSGFRNIACFADPVEQMQACQTVGISYA
jgi:hypothetical protein